MSYTTQTFEDNKTVLKAEHLKHIEEGIVNLEKQLPTDSANYWSGKKFVVNGDSVAYGSTLSSVTDAYPYLIAKKLGMNVTNYAIGGSTVAKRTGDYDECYFNTQKWNEAKASGKLDTTKKYLVNTGENAPRIYQIFTYNGSEWVGGGTSSTVAGRTPLCDRIGAMDTDADVILVHMSSNDWYYDWCPLGEFETGTFRELGYTGSQDETDTVIGELDTTTNLLDGNVDVLVENTTLNTTNSIPTADTNCFTYRNIPVIGGRAVQVPYGRRSWWLDADGDEISTINLTSGATNYTAVAPANASYLSVSFKYAECSPEDCVAYMSVSVDDNTGNVSSGKSSSEPCETYYDGLHKLCKTLLKTYKNKDVFICTPMKRRQYGEINSVYPEDTNAKGKTIKDYCDAVEQVCEYYSIPCINLYKISGLNCHIDSEMFASDFAHPNKNGHERLASIIAAQMRTIRM
jgi:hypothetical protein